MASVLIAYATNYGSTHEVAKMVAEELNAFGLRTEVWPAADVTTLEGFSAVVLGGALYFFRLHRHARRFLKRHHKGLEHLPVAVFAMGPLSDSSDDFAGAHAVLDRALNKEGWFTPVSVAVFGGKIDPETLRFPHSPAMRRAPASDLRDWEAIHEWARSLPDALGLEVSAENARVPS